MTATPLTCLCGLLGRVLGRHRPGIVIAQLATCPRAIIHNFHTCPRITLALKACSVGILLRAWRCIHTDRWSQPAGAPDSGCVDVQAATICKILLRCQPRHAPQPTAFQFLDARARPLPPPLHSKKQANRFPVPQRHHREGHFTKVPNL